MVRGAARDSEINWAPSTKSMRTLCNCCDHMSRIDLASRYLIPLFSLILILILFYFFRWWEGPCQLWALRIILNSYPPSFTAPMLVVKIKFVFNENYLILIKTFFYFFFIASRTILTLGGENLRTLNRSILFLLLLGTACVSYDLYMNLFAFAFLFSSSSLLGSAIDLFWSKGSFSGFHLDHR